MWFGEPGLVLVVVGGGAVTQSSHKHVLVMLEVHFILLKCCLLVKLINATVFNKHCRTKHLSQAFSYVHNEKITNYIISKIKRNSAYFCLCIKRKYIYKTLL